MSTTAARNPAAAPDRLAGRLERLRPDLSELRRVAFRGRSRARFNLGERHCTLRFLTAGPAFTPELGIGLGIGVERGWLWLQSADFTGTDWGLALVNLRATALLHALLVEEGAGALAALSELAGEPVRVLEVARGRKLKDDALLQPMHLRDEDSGLSTLAALEQVTDGFFRRLARLLAAAPARPAASTPEFCLPLRMTLPLVKLEIQDLRKVKAGDCLLSTRQGDVAALHADCESLGGRSLPLVAHLTGLSGRLALIDGVPTMDHPDDHPLDDVGIPITAVIGELEMPLKQLQNIEAGYVFRLPGDIERAMVRLHNGRRCIGTGKLVAIGDRLGVRVIEWVGIHGQPSA